MTNIHPVVRVILFFILACFLALGDAVHLLVSLLLLIPLYMFAGAHVLYGAWSMLCRMRWFFISILVIYFWMTPGQALVGSLAWLPTVEGVVGGSLRVAALVMMIAAVHFLLWCTTRDELIAAIYRLSLPLVLLGVSRERLAVRMALVMERVSLVQQYATHAVANASGSTRMVRIADGAYNLLQTVLHEAENSSNRVVEVDLGQRIPTLHWLWPLILLTLMWWVG